MGFFGGVRRVLIVFNGIVATVTSEGYLDVKTHTPPDFCYSREHTEDRSGFIIATPPSGKQFVVIHLCVATQSAIIPRIYFTGNGDDMIFMLYPEKKSSALSAIICATGVVDQSISLDCGANTFIQFGYNIK